MNKENMLKVAQLIEDNESKFDMSQYMAGSGDLMLADGYVVEACGTPSCVAGWAFTLATEDALEEEVTVHKIATDILGLTAKQANDLFLPESWNLYDSLFLDREGELDYTAITAGEAVDVLRGLVDGSLEFEDD